mgnify:CR=1 FL=1
MSENLLEIKNLTVEIGEKEILHNINLNLNAGETHVLMGPNGAGKTTLGLTIMGNPRYNVINGSIVLDGKDITEEAVNERAKDGVFLSFQAPVEVPGITLSEFLRNALEQKTGKRIKFWEFKKEVEENMALLEMDEKYLQRDLNCGFSGGEKKKAEILQMLMLKPSFAILDETDSGLDVDAVRTVSKGIEMYKNSENAVLIITHNMKILENLKVDFVHILIDGKIVKTGDANLAKKIEENGYEKYKKLEV